MNKEYFYGNGDFNRNDGDASGKPYASSFSSQENEQITEEKENEYIDFNQSNRRLDNYFLTFSSWL
jgi:hypothetical protein